MARITKTTARPTRKPKAEVEQEFRLIQEEAEAAREAADTKTEDLNRRKNAETLQSVDGLTVESVVEKTAGLGLEIGRALTGISARLTEEVERLAAVREAVRIEQEELARLHKIDIAATALDQLVQDYAREKERLGAEIAAQRAEWEQESKATERERKEQEEALRKQRQRETDEYEYKKTLERKKAQDKYDEEQRVQEKANREKQEKLEKSWTEREAALKEQEVELARLKKESETFPARLAKEVEQAAAAAGKAAEARFEQQVVLIQKDAEAEKRIAELRVKTLEEAVAQQTGQMASLQKQLEEAKRQVQEIAVKAIEGASGTRALAHVNQIAMEQAKNRPQG